MTDDRDLSVAELRDMQADAIANKEERGIQLSDDELIFVASRFCKRAQARVRDAIRAERNPHKAIEAASKRLLIEVSALLAKAMRRQARLEERMRELEAAMPKPKVRVRARGVPAWTE